VGQEDILSRDELSKVCETLEKKRFDIEAAADTKGGLLEKFFVIELHKTLMRHPERGTCDASAFSADPVFEKVWVNTAG
jgi:hypothetical protein